MLTIVVFENIKLNIMNITENIKIKFMIFSYSWLMSLKAELKSHTMGAIYWKKKH